ncbi:thioredoxin family protein [Lewinella sp. IMCC34183]|uniref:thioredoxin family protein n=1 Tax=Lewinella sp. IMCC34183 TaxID=2248762 RepID=UPI0013009C00|nr:thioredoxin family protein [Lewinella sp. IMCC34183]
MLRLLVLLCFSTALTAQGINFFTGSWEEALAQAAAEDKLIFVDAYAEWCGPCKMMAANVFPDEGVGDFFNANFINLQLDMEKPESETFRQVHRAPAFPTLLFIDPDNEPVHRVIGARQAGQLLRDGRTALERVDDVDALQRAYEAGQEGAAYKLVRALVRRGEPHLKIANDYLRTPGLDFTAPANLRLIFVATTEADSRLFELLREYEDGIVAIEGRAAYNERVARAVRTSFDKALEYNSERLMESLVERTARYDKDASKRLESEGEFAFALQGHDADAVYKTAKSYLKKGAAGDERRLRNLFGQLENSEFIDRTVIIDLAADALAGAAELAEEGWRDYYNLGRFLQKRRRYDQALKAAEQSLTALGPDGKDNYRRAIQDLVDQLRAQTK